MRPTPNWMGLADALVGTQGHPSESLLEAFDALDQDEEDDEEDIDEKMLDLGIEQCSNCGLWVESGEVVDEDGEIVSCGSCS